MTTKYANDLSELDPNSSHARMVRLLLWNGEEPPAGEEARPPVRRDVLETGCAQGYMTKLLADAGCRVVGLEIDPVAAEEARAFAEEVLVVDLEALDFGALFGTGRFDAIVYGDVLEHVRDPLAVLRASMACLRNDGRVVISIPNIAHGAVRLSLLEGRFRYEPLGILDDTHLRFVTAETLAELLADAGLVVDRLERVEVPIFDTEIALDRSVLPADAVAFVAASPESATYQFVLSAAPSALPTDSLRKMNRAAFGRPITSRLEPYEVVETAVERRDRELDALRSYLSELELRLGREHAEAVTYQTRLEQETVALRSYVAELEAKLQAPQAEADAYQVLLEARIRELQAHAGGGGGGLLKGVLRRVARLLSGSGRS